MLCRSQRDFRKTVVPWFSSSKSLTLGKHSFSVLHSAAYSFYSFFFFPNILACLGLNKPPTIWTTCLSVLPLGCVPFFCLLINYRTCSQSCLPLLSFPPPIDLSYYVSPPLWTLLSMVQDCNHCSFCCYHGTSHICYYMIHPSTC